MGRKNCPVKHYASKVLAGKIPAGKLVTLACQRHIDDLAQGKKRGLIWDGDEAQFAIDFFQLLKHSKGRWGGETFDLSPWQEFIVGSLFGWKRKDGTRRFRIAYSEIPRKNGKSTLAAGIGLFLLVADGEPGAEVYSAATKRDQARLTHSEAKRMVQSSSALRRHLSIFKDNLSVPASNSKYEPLGADADSLDGLNPSGLILDELHAWKTRDLWDVLDTARGARDQPLTFAITTAGVNEHSICGEQRSYSVRVLQGIIQDDSHFAYIATIDEGDDWRDPKAWRKANPNLGVSITEEYLSEQFKKAEASISSQNAMKRLYLDVWTRSIDGWLDMDSWNRCASIPVIPEELNGKPCWGGLDLASTNDIAAFVLVYFSFDDSGNRVWKVRPFFWVPEDGHSKREKQLREILHPWIMQGYVKETPGDVIDIATIEADIIDLSKSERIQEIAYDHWNAESTAQRLSLEGMTMVKFPQNLSNFTEPSKELEASVIAGRFGHGANPVLTWMASNTASISDGRGSIMPSRKKSIQKIDGIPATIQAMARAMFSDGPSVYEASGAV